MHPALSVIFFTTLSGAGYGLLVWTALAALLDQPSRPLLVSLALALGLVTVGLLSSLAHLGQPQRAWRALSQWRTSWLSREGVASVLTYVPTVLLAAALLPGMLGPSSNGQAPHLNGFGVAVALVLIASALATVACTAMIYASLKPIPAWRHRLVVPVYLLFALVCGGLVLLATLAWHALVPGRLPVLAAIAAIVMLAGCKWRYWRAIDATGLPATRGDAIGLPTRTATLFERPGTEANYITREMAFVVARTHARALRGVSIGLLAVLPMGCLVAVWLLPSVATPLLSLAAVSALAGTFVERWLFFAQARHLVTLYY